MRIVTRFNTVRLEQKLSRALLVASSGKLADEYDHAVDSVAEGVRNALEGSGRAQAHHGRFVQGYTNRATFSGGGRYNVAMGWLYPDGESHERGSGGKLWFQYQEGGFITNDAFHNAPVAGIGATIGAREDMLEAVEMVNGKYVHDLARILD